MSNIYDDVALLQEQMDDVMSAVHYKLDDSTTDISNDDLNLLIDKIIFGYGNGCENKPTGSANGYFVNIPHSTTANYNKQCWIERTNNRVWTRYEENGVWSSWILLGGENIVVGSSVPIGMTYGGKQVYCKTVNVGALPNDTTKEVASGLTPSAITVICIRGSGTGGGDWLPIPNPHPTAANAIGCYLRNDGKIVVSTGKDRTEVTATVSIYYTVN